MSETKIQEVMEAVTELRAEVEKAAPDHEKIEKIEKSLDKFEETSKSLVAEQKAREEKDLAREEASKLLEEKSTGFEEQLKALEIEMARGGAGSKKDYHDTPEYKAMADYIRTGEFTDREQKALLRTDSDIAGGFLVPIEMDNSITKKITEISDIRSIARVRTVGAKSLEIPVRATIPSATYEGEAESGADSTSTYSNETLTTFRQTFTSPITIDMLMDAAFDMESEIMSDAAEAFALGEGTNFVNGLGFKTPKGFLQDARVDSSRETSTTGTVDADDIILLSGDLKTGYNPVYTFNRRTLATIRTLKSTDGQFLWLPGLNGVVANTINGYPYLIANDMPDLANASKSIAFGDFLRGYTIVDRTGLSVVRDEFTAKKQAIVEFTMNRWNTGQVTLPEAIVILTTKS